MTMLPNLPKKYKRKEADITPLVFKWFEANYPGTVAIEIKIKGNKVKDHQEIALHKVQDGSFAYKIPDTGRKNPFDGFVLKNAEAFVVTVDERNCEAVRIDNNKRFTFRI